MKKRMKKTKSKLKVIIYSTSWCPWCHKTREFFRKNKIKFKDIDIEKDKKSAEDMVRKSGQMGIPVIDINGNIVVGFDEQRLRKLLNIK